jgi:hypothetical protein
MPKVCTTSSARVRGAHLQHRIGYGDKCERGNNHFVALADAQRKQRQVQPRRAGADRNRVRDAVVSGQRSLKRRQLRPQAEPGRAQNPGHGVDLGLGDIRR